jgi:hypothetical protein
MPSSFGSLLGLRLPLIQAGSLERLHIGVPFREWSLAGRELVEKAFSSLSIFYVCDLVNRAGDPS